MAFKHTMRQLAGGKHTLKFSAEVMGDQYARGSLAIEGGDYQFYAALHEKVKAANGGQGDGSQHAQAADERRLDERGAAGYRRYGLVVRPLERRLTSGASGPLELTDQGMKPKSAAENAAK
jgi:hypothetical protein